jgi:hypothetical protein
MRTALAATIFSVTLSSCAYGSAFAGNDSPNIAPDYSLKSIESVVGNSYEKKEYFRGITGTTLGEDYAVILQNMIYATVPRFSPETREETIFSLVSGSEKQSQGKIMDRLYDLQPYDFQSSFIFERAEKLKKEKKKELFLNLGKSLYNLKKRELDQHMGELYSRSLQAYHNAKEKGSELWKKFQKWIDKQEQKENGD